MLGRESCSPPGSQNTPPLVVLLDHPERKVTFALRDSASIKTGKQMRFVSHHASFYFSAMTISADRLVSAVRFQKLVLFSPHDLDWMNWIQTAHFLTSWISLTKACSLLVHTESTEAWD